MLNVITVLGEGGQGVVAHSLAASEAEFSQKSSASTSNVFDHNAFNVYLKFKQIDVLPIRPI